jgi:T5SS/PEP-CTERM-associated repeat protein
MTNYSWNGGGRDNLWNDPANWYDVNTGMADVGVPGAGDVAMISGVDIEDSGSVHALTVSLFLGLIDGGSLTLSGSGASLTLAANPDGNISVGGSSAGSGNSSGMLSMLNGATASITDQDAAYSVMQIADQAGSTGTVVASGQGTKITTDGGGIDIGASGTGYVSVTAGATFEAISFNDAASQAAGIATAAGGTGTLTVSGAGSTFIAPAGGGEIGVGNYGTGYATIAAGGTLTADDATYGLIVGQMAGSTGSLTVTDSGSALNVDGDFKVGNAGTATVLIKNRATADVGALLVAAISTSSTAADVVTVDGSGSELDVLGNGTVDTATAAPPTNAQGKSNGFGGRWSYTGAGNGQISITNGGFVSVAGTLTLQALTNPAAPIAVTVASGGGMEVGGDIGLFANEFNVDLDGLVIGHGTIQIAGPSGGTENAGTVYNAGTIEAYQGTLELDAEVEGTALGLYDIDKNATLRIDGSVDPYTTITFGGQYTTTLMLDQATEFNGTINQFQEGDVIDLTQFAPESPISVSVDTNGTVTLQPSGGPEIDLNIITPAVVPVIGLEPDATGDGTDIETISPQTLLDISFATYNSGSADGYSPMLPAFPGNGDNGFQAFAYQDTNSDDPYPTVVIAFRGTYASLANYFIIFIKNLLAGSSFVTGQVNALLTRYVTDAVNFVLQVHAAYPNSPLFVTGHSLGGALAQIVGYASGLPVAAFDAPGAGKLISQLSALLAPLHGLGVGGSDVNYRVADDVVSLLGTPLPGTQTFTLPDPYPLPNPIDVLLLNNVLNPHGVYNPSFAFGALLSGPLTEGNGGEQLNLLQQVILIGGVGLVGAIAANIPYGADPPAGTDFVLTISAGSAIPDAIGLPVVTGVASYQLHYEIGSTWSPFQSETPGTLVALTGAIDAVEFDPLDGNGNAVQLPGSEFVLEFSASGQFSGTLTTSGGSPFGPITTASTFAVPADGTAVAMDIPAPTDTDTDYPAATLAIEVAGLPSDGTVTLADGVTPVTLDESLTTAQLTGLTFTPGTNTAGQSSQFSYTVIDPLLDQATGTTTVNVTPVPRLLVWTGTDGTNLANAANWDDTTNNLNPAQAAPDGADTVEFDSSDGGISGSGTVATIEVGLSGSGVLDLDGGVTLVANSLDVGIGATDVGQISLAGSGSNLTVTGSATVADDGTGVMSVLAGATFSAASLTIGSQGDSSGAMVVSGTNSVVNVSGDLNIGTALGTGDLTIGQGAVVNALVVNLKGEVVLENGELDPTVNLINQGQTAGGSGTIAAGDIVDEGVIQAGDSKPSQKLLVVAGTILGGGPWTINGTAQPQANGDVGILRINAGGTMEITGPVLNAASTTFTDDMTPRSTYTVNDSVVEVNFEDATGVLLLNDIDGFAGTIAAFRKGDEFVITGGTLSNLGVTSGNTLTVSDTGNGGTDNLIFSSGISASGFTIVNSNTIQVACFAQGTRIMAGTGLVAVEHLGVGDRVITNDGTHEPIVWIGQRMVNCERHPSPETVWPVRVRTGAFGENVPARDLYLSPDHAVFVNDVLVPVKLLINGTSIAPVKRNRVTYFHVELPLHAVILAEGLPVESYLDTGDRANFGDGTTIRLFPDFAQRLGPDVAVAWETRGAVRLVLIGAELEAARRMTAASASRSASRLGRPTSSQTA